MRYIVEKLKINKFDFEGVNSPNRGWFKLGFGGDLIPYYQIEYEKTEIKKYIPINKGHFFDLEPQHRLDAFKEKISKVGKKNTQNIDFFGMIFQRKEL